MSLSFLFLCDLICIFLLFALEHNQFSLAKDTCEVGESLTSSAIFVGLHYPVIVNSPGHDRSHLD